MNPHAELIHLAAEMTRGVGLPSDFPEDHGFCKTTPIKERRRIIKEAELARETARIWALRVRAAADLLAADQEDVARVRQEVIDRLTHELEEARADNKRLTAALRVANDNHERFEREWYLRGDALERLRGLLLRWLVFMKTIDEQNTRWGEAFNRVRALADEVGVELVEYNAEDFQ